MPGLLNILPVQLSQANTNRNNAGAASMQVQIFKIKSDYELFKLTRCFCVEPKSGKASFGLTLKDSYDTSAENMTCECTEQFRQKLSTANLNKDRIQMEHFAQVHSKCDGTGNFEKLQCINATCFCVDEKTGRPTMDRVATYGALSTLPCCKLNELDHSLFINGSFFSIDSR